MTQVCELCGGSSGALTIHPEGTRHTQPIESCIRELARRTEKPGYHDVEQFYKEDAIQSPIGAACGYCRRTNTPLVTGIDGLCRCNDYNDCREHLSRQLSAAVARAEKAERERDEARAELGKILEAGKEFYTGWGHLDHKAYPEVYKLLYSLTPHMKRLKQEAGSGLSQ